VTGSHRALGRRLPKGRVRRAIAALGLVVAALAVGCSSEEIIVKTAAGTELKAADIDADPLALLPPNSLALLNLDPKQLFQSSLGRQFLLLAQSQMPLPPSAQFEPQRDLDRLLVGFYSAAGADFAGVAVGKFDVAAIKAAAARSEATPLGTPMVAVRYSQWEFYVSANLGFCVLTPKTVLFGNEVGIRRALDRLERGDLRVEQAADVEALMRTPGAPIALGASNADAALDSLIQRTPLATNLRMARVVANLEPPGFNVAGTFTFADASSAQVAKERFEQTLATVDNLGAVGAWFGAQKPIQSHQTNLLDASVQVSIAAETQVAESLLAGLNGLLPKRAASTP
jgi:hypothetical protein